MTLIIILTLFVTILELEGSFYKLSDGNPGARSALLACTFLLLLGQGSRQSIDFLYIKEEKHTNCGTKAADVLANFLAGKL